MIKGSNAPQRRNQQNDEINIQRSTNSINQINNFDDAYIDDNDNEETDGSRTNTEIKINYEKEDEDENEDEESAPFPVPMDYNTLNRTSLLNVNTNKSDQQPYVHNVHKDRWGLVKKEMIDKNESHSAWSNVFKAIKSAPSNTKLFLGIDQSVTGTSSSNNQQNTSQNLNTSRSGLTVNKTLNNWNQRTFRVLNDNLIFGGKLKEKTIDNYIYNLDDKVTDETDPFFYYQKTKKVLENNKRISVPGMAVNRVKKMILNNKTRKDKNDVLKRDPSREFEEVDLPPSRILKSRMKAPADDQLEDDYGFRPNVGVTDDEEDEVKPPKDDEENLEGPCDAFTHACTGNRIFGIGFCGRLCDNYLDPSKRSEYNDLIKSIKQHRPYFTYWVTFVQTVICFVSLFAYGLAPIGFSYHIKRGLATTINLEKQLISYPVKENFWIGPVAMDLVHLGAKYAPCMRNDSNIYKAIELDKNRERNSACCIRNDRGGCVQTNREKCSDLLFRFDKWNATIDEMDGSVLKRNSGSVCGLDPRFCGDPDSNKWPDDITQWPICEKPTSVYNSTVEKNQHMHCEIIGRPCCIGIQGECLITTLEHCNSIRGYFHENAHLCAQVDCMQDVCGMIDFLNPNSPDQVYRLFTSIFIHAGILQLIVTIFFQLFILRDVEKLAGCLRVGIIYTASGVIGNLGSAIFLPYQAEVGPLGSQFGIIACLFVEMFHAWEIYASPWTVFLKLVACLIVLILIGFLPMIDNFANVFGFLSGLLLGSILFPNINLKGICKRVLIISISISIIILIVAALIVLFYVKPIDKCDWCKFLSCPFPSQYCLDMDFNITRLN